MIQIKIPQRGDRLRHRGWVCLGDCCPFGLGRRL